MNDKNNLELSGGAFSSRLKDWTLFKCNQNRWIIQNTKEHAQSLYDSITILPCYVLAAFML